MVRGVVGLEQKKFAFIEHVECGPTKAVNSRDEGVIHYLVLLIIH